MNITFVCGKEEAKQYAPVPASTYRPDWYSKLNPYVDQEKTFPTIKKCMPVHDVITSGYIMFNAVDQEISAQPNFGEGTWGFERCYPKGWDEFNEQEGHPYIQCPVGPPKDYMVISVPWQIKTPPGYSCLIQKPYYHTEDRFEVMTAIIDTDVIDIPWHNWPAKLLMIDEDFILKAGDPIAQIIPFKREDWEMHVEIDTSVMQQDTICNTQQDGYAKMMHNKKRYK
jgi:hypothetical protein|tara:strand:+ start:381 stop:1058 length:678 start_codon:yes stop_codon:yes gene_type:complete